MASKVQEKIMNEIVAPALQNYGSTRVASVLDYNPRTKEATISYSSGLDMHTPSTPDRVAEFVPMIRQEGQHEAGPFVGDRVVISFIGGDLSKPIIMGAIDQRHAISRRVNREKHDGKGSNIADYYTRRTGVSWNVERFRL